MILRPYQNLIMDDIHDGFIIKDQLVCVASMGGGKSIIISETARYYANLGQSVAILTNISELIPQLIFHFDAFGLKYKVVKAGYELVDDDKDVQIWLIMEQSFHEKKRLSLDITCDLLIKDECFTPDVEILTTNGFKRFDELNNDEIVAQYNEMTSEISFVEPTRFIKYHYSGEMFSFESKRAISLSTTPNHEFLIKNNNQFNKIKAKNINKSSVKKIPVCGIASGDEKELSVYEKLAIAFQADGNIHTIYKNNAKNIDSIISRWGFEPKDGHCSILFGFTKKRKIEQFLNDFSCLNISEIKSKIIKGKLLRRFIISNVELSKISKNLRDIFFIQNFSFQKAHSFLNYLMHWDGSILKNGNYYYSSVVKDNVDFVQEISTLANMYSRIGKQVDKRKPVYSDVYRIWINQKCKEITTQTIQKTSFQYEGEVYCVEVPTHNIIVRRNGKVVVIGNCHIGHNGDRFKNIFEFLSPKKFLGLSGTPFDEMGYLLEGVELDELILHGEARELTELGFLVPLKYFSASWSEKEDYSDVKKSGADYSTEDLDRVINTYEHTELIVSSMNHMDAKKKKTLVYCNSIAHAERVGKALKDDGYKVGVVHSKIKSEDNDKIISNFDKNIGDKTGVDCLVSISKLTTGFNQPKANLLVLCRPTQILRLYLQILFRVARTFDGNEVMPKKEFAEVLDLSQCIKTHGFGTEPRQFIKKGHKKKLKEEKEKHSAPCIVDMVKDTPTEITVEDVKIKMKELEMKQLDIKNNSLTNLIKIYKNTMDFNIMTSIVYELNFRTNKVEYNDAEVVNKAYEIKAEYEKLKKQRIPRLIQEYKAQLRMYVKSKKALEEFKLVLKS